MTTTDDATATRKTLLARGKRTLEASTECLAKIDEIQARRAALNAEIQADMQSLQRYLSRTGAADRIANFARRGEVIARELEVAVEELHHATAP